MVSFFPPTFSLFQKFEYCLFFPLAKERKKSSEVGGLRLNPRHAASIKFLLRDTVLEGDLEHQRNSDYTVVLAQGLLLHFRLGCDQITEIIRGDLVQARNVLT